MDTTKSELCGGKISTASAKESLEFIARSSASIVALGAGAKLLIIASVFGPAGVAAAVATTGALLVIAPPLAAKASNYIFEFCSELKSKTARYLGV